MIKVGIVTYHDIDNYGAQLQASSLHRFLNSQGVNTELINYQPIRSRVRLLGGFLRPLMRFKFRFAVHQFRKFLVFRRSALALDLVNQRPIYTLKQLEKYVHRYSALICGSDELWNFGNYLGYRPAYILNFKFHGKKLSYAASMGAYRCPESMSPVLATALSNFSTILVRDSQTRQLVESHGLVATEVVDPTFLVDHAVDPMCHTPYLMVSGGLSRSQMIEIKKVADSFSLPILTPGYLYEGFESSYRHATAEQWVSYIYGAKFHVTSLFHGAALSMTKKVPFVVFLTPGKEGKIGHMMQWFQLESRLISTHADSDQISGVLTSSYPEDFEERKHELITNSQRSLLDALRSN